ncbi:DUF6232 family protein [Streptomyces sp. NPDC056144]|uniref:DUF6232 family protein n=1 Tax=unclassified Streptomyces TaxID=2593676 RepID=UPI0035D69928
MPLPPRKGARLELRVERHILWVASAAVPVRNISWVEVFRLRPAWGKVGAILLLLAILAFPLADQLDLADGGGGHVPGILLAIAFFAVCAVLIRSRKPVLVVELNSGSRVLLTMPSMDELRVVAGQIVYAIDHPDYEFTAVLEQHNTTNNFGSVVHMHGGRGNTGIKL